MPEKLALLGYPVSHSVSPAMHNAALAAARLDYTYEALAVPPGALAAVMQRLRMGEWAGANVTIPHKQAVIDHLDALTETAVSFGAVNTIFRAGERLIGDNTDVGGFLTDLDSYAVQVGGKATLVFGTGGSARAVAFGLLQRRARVRLLGRNRRAGERLARELRERTGRQVSAHGWTPTDVGEFGPGSVLAVNCTPLGMYPNVNDTPWFQVVPVPRKIFVYDLVYNPPDTMLMRQARSHKARAAGGLGMLVWQGALAFERWTGITPDIDVMRAAAEKALRAMQKETREKD